MYPYVGKYSVVLKFVLNKHVVDGVGINMKAEIKEFKPITVLDTRDNDLDEALECLDKVLTKEEETK